MKPPVLILTLFLSLLAGSSVRAELEVVSTEMNGDEISSELVKLTWKAEVKNSGDADASVTLTISLLDAEGNELKSLVIEDFTVPAGKTETAVQSRPVSAETWAKVDDHTVSIEE